MKSKIKWVGLVGIVLSAFSIFIHFLLARFTQLSVSDYQSSITIFSWRPIFDKPDFPTNVCKKILTFLFTFSTPHFLFLILLCLMFLKVLIFIKNISLFLRGLVFLTFYCTLENDKVVAFSV